MADTYNDGSKFATAVEPSAPGTRGSINDHKASETGDSDSVVRVIDSRSVLSMDALRRELRTGDSPILVLVGSPEQADVVVPLLRPQDDLAHEDEGPLAFARRRARLQAEHARNAELDLRRNHVDPLTRLPDRLRCLQWFEADEHAWPTDGAWGLMMVDIDYFTRFNEAHGRSAGDSILKGMGEALLTLGHTGDMFYRFELDEFVVVMRRNSREEVAADAEVMRRAMAKVEWRAGGASHTVGVSAGLAFFDSQGFRYGAIQRADTAMYMAKILGRNNLVLHDDVRRLAHETGSTLELSDLASQAESAKARLVGMAEGLNRRLLAEAREEAEVDALTGLKNRRYLDARLQRQMHSAKRGGVPLAVVMFDIDDFGLFNKRHGHATGDAVLRTFAAVAASSIRGDDWLARYGGEEFCLVMKAAATDACAIADRIRQAVAATVMTSFEGQPISVTVSAGVVTYDPQRDPEPTHLLQRASRANQDAKESGKNLVTLR